MKNADIYTRQSSSCSVSFNLVAVKKSCVRFTRFLGIFFSHGTLEVWTLGQRKKFIVPSAEW